MSGTTDRATGKIAFVNPFSNRCLVQLMTTEIHPKDSFCITLTDGKNKEIYALVLAAAINRLTITIRATVPYSATDAIVDVEWVMVKWPTE